MNRFLVLKKYQSILERQKYKFRAIFVIFIFICFGALIIISSHAATPYSVVEAESGKLTGTANVGTDSNASGGSYVRFGNVSTSGAGGGSSMVVGINGEWGDQSADDIAANATGIKLTREDADTATGTEYPNTYYAQGIKTDVDFSGPYNNGGIIALAGCNSSGEDCTAATTWANSQLSWYETYCTSGSAECPMIEVLNEPSGWWFWANNNASAYEAVMSQNATAYGNLIKATWTVFHDKYGSSSPLILADTTEEGGECGTGSAVPCNNTWEESIYNNIPDINSYYDGVVVHPYGGDSASTALSAEGNRSAIESAHDISGKPIYVTEFGWPTDTSAAATGDSYQWTQQEQADNIYNFINWARSTGYVNDVDYFDFRDYGSGTWYGLECSPSPITTPSSCGSSADYTKKIGWYALDCAAKQEPEDCEN
jgi:hypothetical protein